MASVLGRKRDNSTTNDKTQNDGPADKQRRVVEEAKESDSEATNPKEQVDEESFAFSSHLTLEQIREKFDAFSKERGWDRHHSPRNVLLDLVTEVGELAECFQWKGEVAVGLPDFSSKEREHLGQELSDVLQSLVRLSDRCRVDLPCACVDKFQLNAKKYPAKVVYGSDKKYTAYNEVEGRLVAAGETCVKNGSVANDTSINNTTGNITIAKDNAESSQHSKETPSAAHSTATNGSVDGSVDGNAEERNTSADETFAFSTALSLENIRKRQDDFANERNWRQYHSPRNILLAMVGEVGELAECFKYKDEVALGLPDWSHKDKVHLGQELSDVLIYLIRLADRCRINLPQACLDKFEHNAQKYPAKLFYGSAKKHNEITTVDSS